MSIPACRHLSLSHHKKHAINIQKHKADPARAEDDQLNLFGMEAGNHLRYAYFTL
jgi:hypothetical protein